MQTPQYLLGHPHLDIPTPAVHGQIDEIKAWSQGGCLEDEGLTDMVETSGQVMSISSHIS